MAAMSETTRVFGDLLRQLRSGAALSQEALAERAGLSKRGISDLERGARLAPRLETVRLLADALELGERERADLLAAARPEASATVSAAHARSSPLVALPCPPTRLIGRASEMAATSALLAQEDVRLVTLTGPGGTGKTHLALAVAAEVVGRYPDGVVFVDLSPLADPALVMPTIAATLGVREIAGESLRESLSRFLQDRHFLLVLDNFEQVVEAAPLVVDLLTGCPSLHILVTSRSPLHLRGEQQYLVPPLALPDAEHGVTPEAALQSDAVRLFVQRAQAIKAGFSLDETNAAAVTGICQRLDGLPLAIELAAAWVRMLPPHALLTRLERRLPLLTGGTRDIPARQQTLRHTIAWSVDLLRPEEQILFRRLSVFAGGCTYQAAEAVGNAAGDLPLDVEAGIEALVDASLLQVAEVVGESRFAMLETVREFGLERLEAAGESDAVRQQHAQHFLGSSDSLELGIFIRESRERLARDLVDRDNVRLALSWFDQSGETDALLQLCAAAFGVWFAMGLYREGLHWIERALAQSRHTVSVARVQVLDAAGTLALFQGDYARAAAFTDEELALARELGNPWVLGEALTQAGFLRYRQGEYERAEALLDEALRRLRGLAGAKPDMAGGAGIPLLILGDTAVAQGQFEGAAARYEDALAFFRPSGYVWGPIDAQTGLGAVRFCMGDLARASALYGDSLEQARHLGSEVLVVSALLGLAGIAGASGRPEEGAHLLGAAEGILSSLGAPLYPRDQPVRARALAALTAALGHERLTAAREAGRALTLEEAIAEAVNVVPAEAGQ